VTAARSAIARDRQAVIGMWPGCDATRSSHALIAV
jgi:hypothetical protein